MNESIITEKPNRRYNALTGEWVLVSPHRTLRPWQGKVEELTGMSRPAYDANCYLCPGNLRAGGKTNPTYNDTFVFNNDFSALLPNSGSDEVTINPFIKYENVSGECRVICFSPRHDLTLPEMDTTDIMKVIDVWMNETLELGKKYKWVQVFENKGDIMGCSNPHPHGQIWAGSFIPNEVAKENTKQFEYHSMHQNPLLLDYLDYELKEKQRIIAENEKWLAVVPFWAVWPFEILLLPKDHVLRVSDLQEIQKAALASILKEVTTKYDNLFNIAFPYTMGWHGAPFIDGSVEHWQLHAHFYPPLLRSATVKKFMVGYEMLAEAQRDLTPEQAANMLKKLSIIHYKKNVE